MNINSNGYVLVFAIGVCVATSLTLAVAANALRETQAAAKEFDRQKNVMIAAGLCEAGDTRPREELEKLYQDLLRAATEEEQRKIMRALEKMVLSDKATQFITLWWYKINPHWNYVKGWKIAPSHYLGQQLDQVWLDQ